MAIEISVSKVGIRGVKLPVLTQCSFQKFQPRTDVDPAHPKVGI